MKTFSPFEYVLISIANAAGHDKLTFEERIQWCVDQGANLYGLMADAEDQELYMRGILELQRIKAGQNQSQYMVGFDACSSGLQILACMSGCAKSAKFCGLIDPEVRSDAYSDLVPPMNTFLPAEKHIGVGKFKRKDLKDALMTALYGSTARPMEIFGRGSDELSAFYSAVSTHMPGAWELLGDAMSCIHPDREVYQWTMPDGFEVYDEAYVKEKVTVELPQVMGWNDKPASFEYNVRTKDVNPHYRAVAANLAHSMDSYIVREMKRRAKGSQYKLWLRQAQSMGYKADINATVEMVSLRDCQDAGALMFATLPIAKVSKLMAIVKTVVNNDFDVVTVHDEFKCSPVHMNEVRRIYKELLAEIAESDIAQRIFRELLGDPKLVYVRQSDGKELAKIIREESNYCLA